jgi:hypothetical protein
MTFAVRRLSKKSLRWWRLGVIAALLAYLLYAGYYFSATKRERSRVALMLGQGREIQKLIESYYSTHGAFPETAARLNLPQKLTVGTNPPQDDEDPGLVAFSFGVMDGRISLVFEQSQGAVSGQSIVLEASHNASGVMRWSCTGGTVREVYRPSNCRKLAK